jgi:hypothetical protein
MVGFLATRSEAGLFTVSAVFGLGFSGIIPAYVLTVRELFPASEASMARANPAAVQRLGHGIWRLARRCDLRLRRLLCDRIRHWHPLQPGESGAHRRPGLAPALAYDPRPPPTPFDDEWNEEAVKKSSLFYAGTLLCAMVVGLLGGVVTDRLLRRTESLQIARSLLIATSSVVTFASLLRPSLSTMC